MSSIYILTDHGKLNKKGEALQLWAKDGTLTSIFPYKTDRLVIAGNIEITGGALKLLMRHQVNTIFLGTNGKFNGKLDFQEGKNVFIRKRQYETLDTIDLSLSIAKEIACGKLKNQLSFAQRIKRRRETENTVSSTIERMKNNIEKAEKAPNIDTLRGYEGMGARYYYSIFRQNIIQDWAVFKGRSMHPPADNVNAVLSFLYTLLLYRVDAAIEAEALDPFVGYLHTLDYGKRALTFDLMEEYRTPVADTLCCALFNLGILEKSDFREVVFSSGDYDYPLESEEENEKATVVQQEKKGVLLTKDGLKKVIGQFEKKMDTLLFYPPLNKQISYNVIIYEQVRHFKRVLNQEETIYKPLVLK